MQLSDSSETSKVVLLYVKDFKWTDQYLTEQFAGHLRLKRVYRAIYNKPTESYRVIYLYDRSSQAINLPSLVKKTEEMNYTSDIIEITSNNIVDYEICEEDLDQIIKWGDHKDLNKIISEKRVTSPEPPNILQELFNLAKDDDMREYTERSKALFQINPILHDTMLDVIEHLRRHTDTSIEVFNLSMDDNFGPGINIGKAYDALGRYTSEDKRTNFDPEDLLVAIENILVEYTRVSFE